MFKKYWLPLLVLLVVLLIAASGTFYVRDKAAKEKANEAAATLFGDPTNSPYTDEEGNSVSLEAYLGQILIVNSWASWSPFSVQELQDLNQIAGEYTSSGVTVIAINRKENKDQAQRFLSTLPPLPNLQIVIDTKDYFYGAIGGYAMPETVIYNRAGTIVLHRQGVMTRVELADTIKAIQAGEGS